jgi:16S rRNA (cytosine1402-N4)-methyltransferase
MTHTQTKHIPVMAAEIIEALGAKEGGAFLDCTFGGGGHTQAILESHARSTVFAADRDSRAITRGQALLGVYGGRLRLARARFSQLETICADQKFNGILADLGLSSDQLESQRGFSFNDSSALDMRMEEDAALSAADLINELSAPELERVLRQGGAGKEARYAAQAIVAERPLRSTKDLASVVNRALAGKLPASKTNPATVIFQALRMAVNREIEELEALLESVPSLAKPCAKLAVICFHSLEDQVVAKKMRSWEGKDSAPANWPGARPQKILGKLLTRKAKTPSAAEIEGNSRARSARLRVFEFSSVHGDC